MISVKIFKSKFGSNTINTQVGMTISKNKKYVKRHACSSWDWSKVACLKISLATLGKSKLTSWMDCYEMWNSQNQKDKVKHFGAKN